MLIRDAGAIKAMLFTLLATCLATRQLATLFQDRVEPRPHKRVVPGLGRSPDRQRSGTEPAITPLRSDARDIRATSRVAPDASTRLDAHACGTQKQRMKVSEMMESIQAAFRRGGLVRVKDGRILGGVVAGLGRRFGIDPWPARLLFVLLLMLIPGSQLLVYPILWILMPQASEAPDATAWTTSTT